MNATRRFRGGRAARAIGAVAAVATAIALGSVAPAATAGGGKSGPVTVAYVEVNNNDLANVARYTLSSGAPAFDVGVIFAANINWNGSKAVLALNDRVRATLDDAADQVRPLQAKGIKVELSILGNHQGAGISNFASAAAADDFAQQVADVVGQYGLDGVDLDDEYSDYGANGTAQPNDQSIGWLISALRAKLPGKLISFYDIGPASSALASSSPSIGSQLDYAWNAYYGTYSAPTVPGLTNADLSAAAVQITSTPASTAASLAQRTVSDGYGVFLTYDLPGGDQSAYVSSFTNPLYGQSATYH